MKAPSGARVAGWLTVAAAFVGVWFGAHELWILIAAVLTLLPVQFLVSRAILAERGYPTWFAWFALLMGPLGMLMTLALPVIPEGRRGSH